jgi:predicted dehydrogenase
MSKLKAVIIGCGRSSLDPDSRDHGISHTHVLGYQALESVKVVACADIVKEYAEAYANLYSLPKHYIDYKEMVEKEQPDIVSVCTWPGLHAKMVIHCAKAGVRAIHCEKPMATTFGDAKKMKAACDKAGVQLTFNHQRRFEPQYAHARALVNQGAIGTLQRIEVFCGNLYDWGTHWFDMMNFYNNDAPANWVMGQIDARSDGGVFGVRMEDQGLSQISFSNGVHGLMFSGAGQMPGAEHRFLGSEGYIDVQMPVVRIRGIGDKKLREITYPEKKNIGAWSAITFGIKDLIHGLETGREPELSARKALATTEIIFATYESSRRRGRVDLPLDINDHPLHQMMDVGEVGPDRKG